MSRKQPEVIRKNCCRCKIKRRHWRWKNVKLIQKEKRDTVMDNKEKQTSVGVGKEADKAADVVGEKNE